MADRDLDAFAIHYDLEGCEAEVHLNDVPLAWADTRGAKGSVHATPWIIDGENVLTLEVRATRRLAIHPMGASAYDLDAGNVGAAALVMGGRYEDVMPDRARDPILAAIVWGPVDDGARTLPRVETRTFTVTGRPRWKWQDAPPLDPAADRARLLAFVADLFAAFARGDGAGVLGTMGALTSESAHFGPQRANFAALVTAEIGRLAGERGFALEPYAADDVVLRPIAGGRVIRVERADGGPVIRSPAGAALPFRFRLELASIGGALEIARVR